MNPVGRVLAALFCLCALPAKAGETAADRIEGEEIVIYEWRGAAPAAFTNNGFEQKIEAAPADQPGAPSLIRITASFAPLGSRTAWPVAPEKQPEGWRLNPVRGSEGAGFAASSQTLYQAAYRVIAAVKGRLKYSAGGSADLKTALQQNSGNCVAFASLALQWLREAGIAARPVTGIFMPHATTRLELQGAALHRFIEIYFPGQGWVFTDPVRTFGAVTGEYIYLGPAEGDYKKFAGVQISRRKLVTSLQVEKRGGDIFYTRANVRDRLLKSDQPKEKAEPFLNEDGTL